jgi:hypothetical protein
MPGFGQDREFSLLSKRAAWLFNVAYCASEVKRSVDLKLAPQATVPPAQKSAI